MKITYPSFMNDELVLPNFCMFCSNTRACGDPTGNTQEACESALTIAG